MGLKRTLKRIKNKIRRKRGLILGRSIYILVLTGMLISHHTAMSLDNRNDTYVGLNDDYITLYDGNPSEGNVVRKLFKIDLVSARYLLPDGVLDELTKGFQIRDDEEYRSVLSTYNEYAVNED